MLLSISALSHNHISVLGEQSFRHLPLLHSLMLDHNFLTHQALQGGALTNLTQLEVLALGHNLISMVHALTFRTEWEGAPCCKTLNSFFSLLCGSKYLTWCWIDCQIEGSWFSGSKALRSLRLEGNLLTSLDSGSFPLNDLKYLESLDLSDNLIQHLGSNRSVHLLSESDF